MASHWLGFIVGLVLVGSGIYNKSWPTVACGVALLVLMALLRWVWNKVPTATDEEIRRMS